MTFALWFTPQTTGLIGVRDRALILLGFAGAFRRSELVALDIEDCAFGKDGLTVTLRRSKTDQDAAGRKIGIPYGSNPETCPVRTIQAWIEWAAITSGALFRSLNRHGQVQPARLSSVDVARVVKKLAERAGLDPAKYAGHSLRAGHATAAAASGASERSDHEPNWAPKRADGQALHSRGEFVSGEFGGEVGVVI